MEDGQPGLLERLRVLVGIAGAGGDEAHALVHHELDDALVAHEQLGDVHAERLVGEIAHLADLLADSREVARRRLDDAEAAGLRHRRGQLGPGDPSHRRLHDRVADAQEVADPGRQRRRFHQRCSFTACWTASMMGSQSAPGTRVTVTKSLTPNRLATPGTASTWRSKSVPASVGDDRLIIAGRFTSRLNFMASGLGVEDTAAVAMAATYRVRRPPTGLYGSSRARRTGS